MVSVDNCRLLYCVIDQGWSDCVSFGDFSSYRDRFEQIQSYFAPRFPEATRVGNEMIRVLLEKTQGNPQ